ncbi:MAG TPA: TIR domain-containing protein, partial [Candidatus Acidoferrum sp.]|nr:TIR domain-containing protein [Candidatus Acidoferrum sp.]
MKRLDVPSSRRRQIRRPKRVFISYSHDSEDHKSWVLSLAERLRDDGIDAWLDRYVVAPSEGWPRWILLQMEQADFTLLVCTATYCKRFDGRETVGQGLGASWEGLIANQILYDDSSRNRRFIPVLPPGGEPADIPRQLRASTYYELDVQYSDLCRYLLGTPELRPRPIRRAKPHTIRVKSAGLPAPSPLDAAHVGGFRRANSVSMSLLSPLNCDVFHCAVVATRYGPESGVWTTRVLNDHVLFGPDGNV